MKFLALADVTMENAPSTDGFHRVDITAEDWEALARGCVAGLNDFIGLWHDGGRMRMALSDAALKRRAIVSIRTEEGAYPSVGQHHAPAIRLERAMRDLYGTRPQGLEDLRPWLSHPADPYAFLPVEGEGLHQIPVGPVHAGIIEPGHFRFTANGEAVVRLEERLGYVHKGVEAQALGLDIGQAARLAGRISGDSTVAYSYAFALAVEAALGWNIPQRAQLLRAIMAELERLSHHVNDIGAICNDASVVAIMARCTLLREQVLKVAKQCFGHRMTMDRIVPGGVAADLGPDGPALIEDMLQRLSDDFERIMAVYDNLPSLQDRTVTTGTVKPELVKRFAAGGHVGRAAGRAFDTRSVYPYAPYDVLDLTPALRQEGDVDARLLIRADEVRSSIGLIRQCLKRLAPGPIVAPMPPPRPAEGAAMVEAFRGDVLISVRINAAGRIAHFHARDASWFQWPLLEAAIEGNIVADFPLCNKSFNCSYSGHDI